MDTTTQLTGVLPAVLIVSALLTAFVAWLLLRIFKKATLKAMGSETGKEFSSPHNGYMAPTVSELYVETLTNESINEATVGPIYKRFHGALQSLVTIYKIGGIGYTVCMAIVYLIIVGNGFVLGSFLWLLTCFAWPTILTILLVSPKDGHKPGSSVLIYFGILAIVALITAMNNSAVNLGQLVFFWLWVNGPSTLMLSAFLRKKVRAVGPMVLAFMILAVAGANMALNVVDGNDAILRGIVELGDALGLGATALFILILILGFVLLGFVGWIVLRKLGARYQKKKFSDQSLTIDSLWLIFGVIQSITLAFEGVLWILAGLFAFMVYKLLVIIGFRRKVRQLKKNGQVPKLLLLRVFALGKRSELFFGWLSKWWRTIGSINLISGPDLITSSVEPHEFLDFLGGRLSRQYVYDSADLNRRLSAMDFEPDPDGRYRINAFFCRADNWKITMQMLSRQSDVVLMDLRSFSPSNKGCIYELEQLLDLAPLSKIIFLVDVTTDLQFLKETLKSLWKEVHKDSPNLDIDRPTASLLHLKENHYPTKILLSTLIARSDLR